MKILKSIALLALLAIGMAANASTDPKATTISKQIKNIMQEAEVLSPTSNDGEITIFFRVLDNNQIAVINAIAYDQEFINNTRKVLEGKELFVGDEYKNRDLKIKVKYQPVK